MKQKTPIRGFWENYLTDKSQKDDLLPLCFCTMLYKIVMPGIAREGITNMLRMAGQRAANKVDLYCGVWIELKFVYSYME